MHIPVLKNEVLKYLNPKPNENFIDCTIGEGGHTETILECNGPNGKILGIDWDARQIKYCEEKFKNFGGRITLVRESFANLKSIVENKKYDKVSGILFDLGMSSWHIEESGKGFSFKKDEPLIMIYGADRGEEEDFLTAEEIVNQWRESEIEAILKEYGEERFAKGIARRIVEARKIKPVRTTFQLAEIIRKATPGWYHHKKIHFATRTFQALRITANAELENVKKALSQAFEILENNGRLVVISFHSLEDRIVKNFFKERAKENLLEILTKKPVRAGDEERDKNPRSRSAKLRAAAKLKF